MEFYKAQMFKTQRKENPLLSGVQSALEIQKCHSRLVVMKLPRQQCHEAEGPVVTERLRPFLSERVRFLHYLLKRMYIDI